MGAIQRDDALREFATDRQRVILEAYWKEGSTRKAARTLGAHQSTISKAIAAVKKKAALRGYSPEHDMTHIAPDGFNIKGTSTLYRDGEATLQWVKTSADRERQEEMLKSAMQGFAADLPRAVPTDPPKHTASSTMACYPIGDHHLGMYAWHKEAGGNYDIPIAEKLLSGAFSNLTEAVPPSDKGTVVSLGDFMHYSSMVPETPTGRNKLDADGRFAEMYEGAGRALRGAITMALAKHRTVHVIIEIGNHDLSVAICLMLGLRDIYENEPRVTVDVSPSHFHYFSFGKNLVGVHHGHGPKLDQLPLIMASDRPEDWGKTEHRYWWTGHIHKQTVLDIQGCRVESFRTLPPNDAWAQTKGYRSSRDMSAIVLHEKYGEVARYTVNPAMLEAA